MCNLINKLTNIIVINLNSVRYIFVLPPKALQYFCVTLYLNLKARYERNYQANNKKKRSI